MSLNLKTLEKLIKNKLEIVDIYKYAINSEKEIKIIKKYFSEHESIKIKIEYNHPTSLEDFSRQYTVVFSKKEEI